MSFAWRSILAAQAIVRNGRRWQVGNGHSIMIWKDKWVPSPSTYKVVSPVSNLPEDSRVAALIDEANGAWKNELVRQIFLPHEADLICSIALSANLPAYKQAWALMHNGIFSVRSAYKLAMEMSSTVQVGGVSDDSQLRRFWKYLWSCNIPHKIRHFAWRACKDVLPTKENLVRRKVLVDSVCDECQTEEESSGHLFWRCQRASEVWRISSLFLGAVGHQFGSFMDMLWYVVMTAQWDQSGVENLIVIAWALWSNQNEYRNGGAKKSAQSVVQGALEYLGAYQACLEVTRLKQSAEVVVWTPPSPNRYKINVDGAVFKEQKMAGVGIVIRDAAGQLIGACSKKITAPLGAMEVEAKVVELGLQFAKDMSILDFTLESDSLSLVNALRDLSPPPLSVAALVFNSISVAHSFRNVDFAHVSRNGNRPAHLLARHALGIADLSIWVEESPCFLKQALNQDVLVNFSD